MQHGPPKRRERDKVGRDTIGWAGATKVTRANEYGVLNGNENQRGNNMGQPSKQEAR